MKYVYYALGIIALIILVITGLGMYKFNYLANQSGYDVDGNKEDVIDTTEGQSIEIQQELSNEDQMTISIASWNLDGSVSFQEYIVPQRPGVLDASLQKIFAVEGDENGVYNGLSYSDVILDNGIARIFLEGDFIAAGDLSGAFMRNNINQTAFQFDTVDTVEVYVNDQFFDWCIDSASDEGPCPETPQYWIDSK